MPVDPISLLAVPLTILLIILLALAGYYDFVVFRRRKNKHRTIYRCSDCRHIYTAWQRTPLAPCPKCGKQNEPVRNRG